MIFNFYFSVSELICKWILTVLVSIAGSESTSTWQEGNKKREDGERGGTGGGRGGNDYSKEATISNISIYRGWLFKGSDESKNGYYLMKIIQY